MSGFLRVNTAPSDLVTLTQVKAQTRIDGTAEDTLLGDYISAASAAIDGPLAMAGRAFASQAWDYVMDRFCQRLLVPVPGASGVSSVSYYDADDNSQSLTASDYFYIVERDDGLLLQLKDGAQLPVANEREDAVTITVSAGGTVPTEIQHACLLTVANWWENREMGEIPQAAHYLVNLHRTGWAGA